MTATITKMISRRPIPAIGYDVHLYDLRSTAHVILVHNQEIAAQRNFKSFRMAETYARRLADQHHCALIRHKPNFGEHSE